MIPLSSQSDPVMPYVIGAIGGMVTIFVTGFFKEFFDERARITQHKRNVARHVLKICIEASTNNFKIAPREMEDIYSVLTDLEGIDKKMSVEMEKFVSSWGLIIEHSKSHGAAFLKENLDRVEKKRKILVAWANKIRAGNLFTI